MLDLPAAADERLERAPITLVVWQARYPRKLAVSDVGVGLSIQRALSQVDNWRLDEAQSQVVVALALSGAEDADAIPATATGSTQRGWRVQSADRAWTATIFPQSVGLETTRYQSWAHFSERLGVLLTAVGEAVSPEAEERLGLRYINRIEEPRVTSAAGWATWIRPEVLGIVSHPGLGPGVLATQQQVDFQATPELNATLRHGLFREETSSWQTYVVDIDTYRSGVRPFDQAGILEASNAQNGVARQLFQNVITEDMYRYLRGEDR